MSAKENKACVRRALDHFNQGDLETYLDLYDAGAVMHDVGIEPGIENIHLFYQGYLTAFPDANVAIEDLVAEGDRVMCRNTFTGTHQGPLMGIPPTGSAVTISAITILRFAGGKCIERWTQADNLSLMQQLGILPAPQRA